MSKCYLPETLVAMAASLPADRPFTTTEAERCGVGVDARCQLVGAGLLVRPLRSVYRAADLPDGLSLRIAVLRLVVPPDCVVTDRTAAWLWGASMALAPGDHLTPPDLSVFAPPGRRLRNGLTASGERDLSRRDVVELEGLLVTSPLRTACDVARLLHRDQAIAAMDALAGLRRFSVGALVAELTRFKGYRGIIQARGLAPLVDAQAASQMESILRLRWIDAGLPRPVCQLEVPGPRGSFFLDMGLRRQRLAAEYDGVEFHGEGQRAHDEQRRAWMCREGGWRILVFVRDDVVGHRQRAAQVLRAAWARDAKKR